MSLLKYDMECTVCNKQYIVLTKSDESEVPNICPFCGSESGELDDNQD